MSSFVGHKNRIGKVQEEEFFNNFSHSLRTHDTRENTFFLFVNFSFYMEIVQSKQVFFHECNDFFHRLTDDKLCKNVVILSWFPTSYEKK